MNLTSHPCPTTSLFVSRFCSNHYRPLYTPGTVSKMLLIPLLMQESFVSPSSALTILWSRPSDSFIWTSPSGMFLLFSPTSSASTSSPAFSCVNMSPGVQCFLSHPVQLFHHRVFRLEVKLPKTRFFVMFFPSHNLSGKEIILLAHSQQRSSIFTICLSALTSSAIYPYFLQWCSLCFSAHIAVHRTVPRDNILRGRSMHHPVPSTIVLLLRPPASP